MEKPVAVDATGIQSVIASAQAAKAKRLSIVTGTQRRHERCYLEAIKRLQDGTIGKVTGARAYWNQGGLWNHARQPAWSDMEWQLRNWLYFTWLSGDHIVEQHVHNLDAMNWAIGATPLKCWAMGGRQVRTSPEYGHVFDHFAVEYEYPNGITGESYCRQIEGCADRVEEVIEGTDGRMITSSGRARIEGSKAWKFQGENPNPYVQEHVDFIKAITTSEPLNEAQRVAESTMTAIMGRMAAYTGKVVTWEQAMNSKLDLRPPAYEFGPMSVPEVAVPGKTALV
jgi:predicted dehydrogenase